MENEGRRQQKKMEGYTGVQMTSSIAVLLEEMAV
eukprot:CAMPEP_0197193716 /NCGR_PEP_ID=MMETSP1423-20130617/27844_1 /TAXON_ID=476441 /ORGANISM="Pseudo-nitzschia heimii, Strain UNC1101" /LENGTH=33 /DNA_ID= /DNA_START= /DNA_END= /DNA_ORIENTATION=